MGELGRHWAEGTTEALPSLLSASGFDQVAAWLETCASASRADKVRNFIDDLADYCRRFILSEPSMTEINDTADTILRGGEETLQAARTIAAAVPLAMTRDVARRSGGAVDMIGSSPAVRVIVEGVPLAFVLFGHFSPWAGVTDKAQASQLQGTAAWGPPERLWPRWSYLKKVGEQGQALAQAAALGDSEAAAQLIPVVARLLIGSRQA